jgi:hypothetical protein
VRVLSIFILLFVTHITSFIPTNLHNIIAFFCRLLNKINLVN